LVAILTISAILKNYQSPITHKPTEEDSRATQLPACGKVFKVQRYLKKALDFDFHKQWPRLEFFKVEVKKLSRKVITTILCFLVFFHTKAITTSNNKHGL
jgi:hypothetical protein